jgi:hypothetical protein
MSLLPGAKRSEFKQERTKQDWYIENTWAGEQLFATLELQGPIHDPFCGEGRIVMAARRAGYEATGADIVDRGFSGAEIIDFRTDRRPRTTLVFNPPYDKDLHEECIVHALQVASHAVVALGRIPFLCGEKRYWDLFKPCPPSLILTCSQRVNCPPGGIGAKEDGGTIDYAWLVWSRAEPHWKRGSGPSAHGWWLSPWGTISDWLIPLNPPTRPQSWTLG